MTELHHYLHHFFATVTVVELRLQGLYKEDALNNGFQQTLSLIFHNSHIHNLVFIPNNLIEWHQLLDRKSPSSKHDRIVGLTLLQ